MAVITGTNSGRVGIVIGTPVLTVKSHRLINVGCIKFIRVKSPCMSLNGYDNVLNVQHSTNESCAQPG